MAFGDSGIGGGDGFFRERLPWTEGEIRGVDGAGNPVIQKNVKLVVDTGALFTTVDGYYAQGMRPTAVGVIQNLLIAGFRATGYFTGITFRFQAVKGGANVTVDYTGRFGITPIDPPPPSKDPLVPPFTVPPLLGATLFVDRAITVTVDYPAKTVKLSQ